MYRDVALHIGGKAVSGGGRRETKIRNPATEEVLGVFSHATAADLDAALDSARRAFETWRRTPPHDRAAVLHKVAGLIREGAAEIARSMTLDQGKPVAEAMAEVLSCAEHADWHAEECRRLYGRVIPARQPEVRQLVVREPVGVCAAFTPWNFPFNQAIRKILAALGAGCTIVLKGPEHAPSAVEALADLFAEAGLPDGCLNLVWGEPAAISEALIRSPIVRKVSFTGSVAVGKQLAALAGQHMKRATMELGGHAPVLVFDDAEADRAALTMAFVKRVNAGQVCVSPTRFFVQDGVYDRFLERFAGALGQVNVGNGLDESVQMGPLCHAGRVTAMEGFVADARERGGRVVVGGERLGDTGYFFAPTVVADLPDDARLMTEEPFGPIATVSRFSDIDEALTRANALPFGLAAYAFTTASRTARRVGDGLEAGMVGINHFGLALAETPFGGVKDSGYGSEGGAETFDSYLTTKFISQLD